MTQKGEPRKIRAALHGICAFIVDKRKFILAVFLAAAVFSLFSGGWVKVENSLAAYLPAHSESQTGLELMDREFVTYASAKIMVENVSPEEAESLAAELRQTGGVFSVAFDDTAAHYTQGAALFSVTLDSTLAESRSEETLATLLELLDGREVSVSSEVGKSVSGIIAREMQFIIVLVAVVIVAVLLLTSQTYAEIPVLLLTFLSAALINRGTNFLLGTISFVSNSVTVVLQLALSIDYAIILCNRFKEERGALSIRDAAVAALEKSIPEIFASSLTTIGGLVAMLFMRFRLGPDMAVCLIKAILISLLSVFLLMPGLLVLFGRAMDRSHHRSFVPRITPVGKFAHATRRVVPLLFLMVIAGALVLAQKCPYVYGYSSLHTVRQNERLAAQQKIADTFGQENPVAIVVPAGDPESEAALLRRLAALPEVRSVTGLATTEAMGGYCLTDGLTAQEFASLTGLDARVCSLLFASYAVGHAPGAAGDLDAYRVPLLELIRFLQEKISSGALTPPEETAAFLETAYTQVEFARVQLLSEEYSRMLVNLDLPADGEETYAFLDTLRATVGKYFPAEQVLLVGNSTTYYDFCKTFSGDNRIVTAVSILIVLVVLLGTFRSFGMPLLLILVIQGSIWINFSIPALTGGGVFFISYLVVSSIQMGANIDYAIVISCRFRELKERLPLREAMIETLNLSFPTIITSGTMMAVAGLLIGLLTSEAAIAGIGLNLGRGTLISLGIVLLALPQILLLKEELAEKRRRKRK